MERLMRQMGMKSKELEGVEEVVIRLADKELVISNAQVVLVEFGGQRTYQVVGEEKERPREFEPAEEDVKLVMEQTGASREQVVRTLKETGGDLAEAIVKLKSETA